MTEFAGFVSKVNLDGRAGCAEVDVRCLVPVDVARRLSALMLVEGSPIRVEFPTAELPTDRREGGA